MGKKKQQRPEFDMSGIDFQAACESGVKLCQAFLEPGQWSCKEGRKCPFLHAKNKKLYPSMGVPLAKRVINDPSLPAVLPYQGTVINPVLGITHLFLVAKREYFGG